ncbi:hypothetical protein U9M48_013915 [Paspalum notatum var. saurae]|uniref:KIB1-4 beta-propeller domain-containing protein n=1 Tax=Paspalum notatum var. saurae TaxID=547442 RepID=A0AAQ3T1G4_PASNO
MGLVVKCLPSLADRVRLRAVCHQWRSNARSFPLLPWLTLPDGAFPSIPDGEIIRMPVPEDARCCGSIDNWLLLMKSDGACSLMNAFSKATVELPKLADVWRHDLSNAISGFSPILYKPVILSPLDSSPDSLVAVLILDDGHCSTVCICQPPTATDVSSTRAMHALEVFDDVAFFNGKLHGVASSDKLFVFDIDYDLSDKPKISSIRCIINFRDGFGLRDLPHPVSRARKHIKRQYLVECCGRLLRVRRFLQSDRPGEASRYWKHQRTVAFDVFEAGLSTNSRRWRKVNNLGGQVLFVGHHCSKSFPVVAYNGIQGDCIYFMCDYYPSPRCVAHPLHDAGVYNMQTGMITPLLPENAAVPQRRHGGHWRAAWIFPADYM